MSLQFHGAMKCHEGSSAVTKDTVPPRHYAYGQKQVIHVVGPDFSAVASDSSSARKEAMRKLEKAYKHVLEEFLDSGATGLRMLPVSGGIFAGPFQEELPRMTFASLNNAFRWRGLFFLRGGWGGGLVCVCGDLARRSWASWGFQGVLDFPFEHLPSKGFIVGVARCVLGVCRP
ncbi:unnamed protein product [Effrenium voratum]|nr:unnamed protein product [Effrenium voratum]